MNIIGCILQKQKEAFIVCMIEDNKERRQYAHQFNVESLFRTHLIPQ
jgi:hypothetical protein